MGGLRAELLRAALVAAAVVVPAVSSWCAPARFAVPDEVLVRFKTGTTPDDELTAVRGAGGAIRRAIGRSRVRVVKLPPGLDLEIALERLRRHPRVEAAAPNGRYVKKSLPNDPLLGWQWGLNRIGATLAWGLTVAGAQGSSEVIIAVLDDGIDSTHPDLAGKVLPGHSTFCATCTAEPDPPPFNGHGTFVASVAAATTDDGIGMAGVAWRAKLLPVKIFDSCFSCTQYTFDDLLLDGLEWAVDHGARVVNMSIGSCFEIGPGDVWCEPPSSIMEEAMRQATLRGALLVAAAGNEATTMYSYPAAYSYVLGVGATQNDDTVSPFSNRGANVDVAAPGGSTMLIVCDNVRDIIGCTNDTTPGDFCVSMGFCPANCHVTSVGTSFAAPHAAGLAAVLLAADPARTPLETAGMIRSTADFVLGATGWTETHGWGRINLHRALTLTPPAPGARLVVEEARILSPPCSAAGGLLTLTVRNDGTAPAIELLPAAGITTGGRALRVLGEPAWSSTMWLRPGESFTFAWQLAVDPPGPADIRLRVEGIDQRTGANVRADRVVAVCAPPDLAASARPYAAPNPVTADTFRLVIPLAADATVLRVGVWNAAMKRVWRGEWTNVKAGQPALPITGVAGWAPGRYLVRATAVGADGTVSPLDPVKVVVKR